MSKIYKHPLLFVVFGLLLAYFSGGIHGYIYAIEKYSVEKSRIHGIWSNKR